MGEPSATAPDGWQLVLASASPRRAALLARLDLEPQIRPTEVDETPHADERPEAMVQRLATTKVRAASRHDDREVVVAADTTVAIDGAALGKPGDDREATAMLRRLAGRTHTVYTAVAVRRGDTEVAALAATQVTFRALSDAEIAWYVATGEPRDKAGAYALQGAGAVLVTAIRGADTTVIGLPLATTAQLLRQVGADVLSPPLPRFPQRTAAQPVRR